MRVAELFYRVNYVLIKFVVTLSGQENRYAKWLFCRFGHLPNVVWSGEVSREEVYQLNSAAKALIFTSHLETWGLPLTEFSRTGKVILAPDLPYVHETLSEYDNLVLYRADDILGLFGLCLRVAQGSNVKVSRTRPLPKFVPSTQGWKQFIETVLS